MLGGITMKSVSSDMVIRKLKRELKVREVRGKGSHRQFILPNGHKVTVPHPKKDLIIKTLRSIEKQTGIKF